VDLERTLERSLAFFQEKLRRHGITVECRYEKVSAVRGDPDRLQQVFLNLFVNAADAMPEGGTLDIGLEAAAADRVAVRVRKGARYCRRPSGACSRPLHDGRSSRTASALVARGSSSTTGAIHVARSRARGPSSWSSCPPPAPGRRPGRGTARHRAEAGTPPGRCGAGA
jgi:hypothetical protein